MPSDVIFPDDIPNWTPVWTDRILFSSTANSWETQDWLISDLPISDATQNALNDKQNTITLTTTWNSWPATLISDVLNIPQYTWWSSAWDVVWPSSAIDENIAVFDTTTGKLIKDWGKKISELQPSWSYEVTTNKVTSLSSLSTNIEYPWAKLVYDNLETKQTRFVWICECTPITEANITIDYTARTLTIVPPLWYFDYYTDWNWVVTKHTQTWNITFPAWTNTSWFWYFYFDSNWTAITTQTQWTDFNQIATIYRLNRVSTNSPDTARSVAELLETHLNTISASDHQWKHTYWAVWSNWLDIANTAIATWTPNVSWVNTCFSLTTGTNIDDNLPYTVTNSTGWWKFQQDMWNTTPANITISNSWIFWVRYKGAWWIPIIEAGTRFPFLWDTVTNRPQYINGAWVKQLVASWNFFVYFVYWLQDPRNWQTIRITPAYAQYNTLALAQAVTWDAVKSQDIYSQDNEIRPLYRVIFEYRSTYNVAIKFSALRDVQDLRKFIVTQSTSVSGSLPASSVTIIPTGNISSLEVQSAINELDTEKVPTTRTITINGTALDLSADRSWSVWGWFWTAMPWTPTRASNTTFTVTWDVTSYVAKWMVIKWTESSTVRCAMVSIPSTYSSPNTTITIIWDTMASIDASSLKYCFQDPYIINFAVAWSISATWTDVTNVFYANEPYRVLWAEISTWIVASTSWNTVIDINKWWTTMFTVKPTIAYNTLTTATPFTADTTTSLALNDRVSIDIDTVTATTFPTDIYIKLYLFPTRYLSLT